MNFSVRFSRFCFMLCSLALSLSLDCRANFFYECQLFNCSLLIFRAISLLSMNSRGGKQAETKKKFQRDLKFLSSLFLLPLPFVNSLSSSNRLSDSVKTNSNSD